MNLTVPGGRQACYQLEPLRQMNEGYYCVKSEHIFTNPEINVAFHNTDRLYSLHWRVVLFSVASSSPSSSQPPVWSSSCLWLYKLYPLNLLQFWWNFQGHFLDLLDWPQAAELVWTKNTKKMWHINIF